jgi:hypothetical protein
MIDNTKHMNCGSEQRVCIINYSIKLDNYRILVITS